MKIFEVIIDEQNLHSGVNAISLVDSPAIESDFITLKKEEQKPFQMAEVDAEKRILMGAVLIPNKPILRTDPDGEGYYIIFSKDTIRKAMELFFMRGNQSETTEMHKIELKGNTVVESWVVSMKILDSETYAKAKAGELKGFSIEGFFTPQERDHLQKMAKQQSAEEKLLEIRKIIQDG